MRENQFDNVKHKKANRMQNYIDKQNNCEAELIIARFVDTEQQCENKQDLKKNIAQPNDIKTVQTVLKSSSSY